MTLIEDQNEEHDAGVAPEADAEEPRRYPSTIGGALYLCVLLAMGAGLVLVAFADWRVGIRVIAGALAAAAVFRLVLPQKDAGMLAVRRRWVDVVVVGSVSAVLFFLASSIPDQPGL
ncbi:Na+-transporting NADH:ubiquinone oxidoreductase subunit NqrB [Nocardioides thalensis]|uniref:Na+-transporting NADH:ubiquinone oxidoreductase subunit NqrB n=1 Tax=Nocardioides thalensis TaxID=1914755 RepID=A0A853C332_9ACTN|nr:Na+-transporting NADH:ubiquinone oxidoreductase subunit NqrB [Nocardioides thalensis]